MGRHAGKTLEVKDQHHTQSWPPGKISAETASYSHDFPGEFTYSLKIPSNTRRHVTVSIASVEFQKWEQSVPYFDFLLPFLVKIPLWSLLWFVADNTTSPSIIRKLVYPFQLPLYLFYSFCILSAFPSCSYLLHNMCIKRTAPNYSPHDLSYNLFLNPSYFILKIILFC